MISRDEATKLFTGSLDFYEDWHYRELDLALDKIYNSIGSCGECTETLIIDEELWCHIHQSPCNSKDFCSYFNSKKDKGDE